MLCRSLPHPPPFPPPPLFPYFPQENRPPPPPWTQPQTPLPRTLVGWGRKKPINRKHINIFLTALVGQSSLGTKNPHPFQGQTGQNGDFTVELNRKRPVCPGEGSRLSQGRFVFVPDTVPPKMFMFIGFFLARVGTRTPLQKLAPVKTTP